MKYQDIAVAWIKKDRNGKGYLSVKVSKDLKAGESFNLFTNDKGGVDTRPDYRAYEKVEEAAEQVEGVSVQDINDDIPF
jgi:uncharacterized protein (DUF736 family)